MVRVNGNGSSGKPPPPSHFFAPCSSSSTTSLANGRSGKPRPPSSFAPCSSSSTLSPLAPPFTYDRYLAAVNYLSSPPPSQPTGTASSKSVNPRTNPNGATVQYISTGDSVWPPASSSSTAILSRSGNLNSVSEAAPYYPYYAPGRDSADDSLGQLQDYNAYVGGWNEQFDVEKGIPARGSVANSIWTDPSPCSQMSLPSHKKGSAESFSAYDEPFVSWHGAQIESSSVCCQVGSDLSECLDNKNPKTLTDGFLATKLDTIMWPSDGSSYFYSPETSSEVKECNTFISSSYDRYISQLSSCSSYPTVHYPASMSSSRQGYPPSNEWSASLFSSTGSQQGSSVIQHANLQTRNDDYEVVMRHNTSTYKNNEYNDGIEKMDISGDAMRKNSGTLGSSLPVKGLSSGNSSPLGQSIDCLPDGKPTFNVTNLSLCIDSNPDIGGFISDACAETSSEIHEHANVAVDSPCWKGASVSRVHPFGSDEIIEPPVIRVISGIEQSDAVTDLPAVTGFSYLDHKLQDYIGTERRSNPDKIENLAKTEQSDASYLDHKLQDSIGTERRSNPDKIENLAKTEQQVIHVESNVLTEQGSVLQGISDHTICEGSSFTGESVQAVQNSDFGITHISKSPNCPCCIKTCTSNGEMILSPHDTIFSHSLKKTVASDTSGKCLSRERDTRSLVKAMLSLSEVLLCHYCNDNDSSLDDLKPVRQIIDNLETVILRNKKGIKESCSCIPKVNGTQSELMVPNFNMSCNNGLKDIIEKKNFMRSFLSNGNHDIVLRSFDTNFEVPTDISQSFTNVLKSGFIEEEEDPKMPLYKKLWMQTEASLCSLKHDVALMKLEMDSIKHQCKGPAEPDSHRRKEHQGPNCATSISVSSPCNKEVGRNHMPSISKEDDEASVFARFRILKDRPGADFASSEAPQIAEKSTAANPSFVSLEKLPGSDYRIGNGLFLQFSNAAGAHELEPSASEGSVIQNYNSKNHVKWLFSNGSGSTSSEWEQVAKDESSW